MTTEPFNLIFYILGQNRPSFQKLHTDDLYLSEGKRFVLNSAWAFKYNSAIPRNGEWSTPWKTSVLTGYEMPDYDANFKKTFEEVTDQTAIDMYNWSEQNGRILQFSWSGGIDSTTMIVSLLKNLTDSQRKNMQVCLSADSILENPNFFNDHIRHNFKIVDSDNFDLREKTENNFTVVMADLGDGLFGTELGTKLYPRITRLSKTSNLKISDSDLEDLYNNVTNEKYHFSKYENIIIHYFNTLLKNNKKSNYSDEDKDFGKLYYEKMFKNIKTSSVPIHSLHDFFWWIIFNQKSMHCALRSATIHSTGRDRTNILKKGLLNWYNGTDYQLWSMANNNNGNKIRGKTQGSYKWVAKKYIYDFDNNDWYFYHKIKFASMPQVVHRNFPYIWKNYSGMFGVNDQYQVVYYDDPGVMDQIEENLENYKIDW